MAIRTEPMTGTAVGEFTISRVFDAPRDVMWRAWTECDRLKHWWGPKGFTVSVCKIDLRPGGTFHYRLRSPDGQDMWGRFLFREIVPREKLVFLSSFSDETGGVTRHPLHSGWPLQMLSTILFTEENSKTTVTVKWLPHEATGAERKVFEDNFGSMRGGWTGTFEQLAAYLANA